MHSGQSHTDPLCFRDAILGRANERPAWRGIRFRGRAEARTNSASGASQTGSDGTLGSLLTPNLRRLPPSLRHTRGSAATAVTSFGQGWVGITLGAFVNSVSAWLVLPFFTGALMKSKRGAALTGFLACGAEPAWYYLTAHFRGLSAGGNSVPFWLACAVLGGPVLGVAGRLWRSSPPRFHGLGAAVLSASFLGEGLWTYAHELHYYSDALLWVAIGLSLAVVLNRRGLRGLNWIAVTLPLALAGNVTLTIISSQPF